MSYSPKYLIGFCGTLHLTIIKFLDFVQSEFSYHIYISLSVIAGNHHITVRPAWLH